MTVDEGKTDGGPLTSYSRFACIGSGFSAIGLGATLKRWYGIDDVRFFEKHSELGGTWFANQYPGTHAPERSFFPRFLTDAKCRYRV